MATKRKVGNLLALAVLAYLVQRPMHPYELSRTLRDHGDDRSIKFNHGTLYMVVQQLEKAGFVAAQETNREGERPERTIYALTDAGRQELRDWLRDLLGEPEHEYPSFVAALSLVSVLPPSQVIPLLRQRLRRLAERAAETRRLIDTTLAQGVAELFLVEEQYRLAIDNAESDFVTSLIDRMTDAQTSWAPMWAQFHGEAFPGEAFPGEAFPPQAPPDAERQQP
jgi:DNA-binding PadR family transcriptional regulator